MSEVVPMADSYIIPLADGDAPNISGFLPASGKINKKVNISVLASDNVKVSKIILYLKAAGGDFEIDGEKYFEVGSSIYGSGNFGTVEFDTQKSEYGIVDGEVRLLAVAVDSENNEGRASTAYIVDNTAPSAPNVSATAVELGISLKMDGFGLPQDFSHFNIYREIGRAHV